MGVIDQQKTFDENKPNSAPTWGNGYAIPQFQPNTAVNANAQPLQGPSTLENQQQTATIDTDASQLQGKKPYNANFNVFARSPQANTNPNLGGQAVVNMNPKVNTGSVQGTQPKTAVVPEGQNGNFVQNVQFGNQGKSLMPRIPQQQTTSQPMNYQQFRDAMFGSEEEKRKKANNRAKVLAIGDALRHIGNLAYVSGMGPGAGGAFASPQQYKTAPAGEEIAKYEAEKKERDAMGWQEMQYAQKRKQQELENEIARQNQAIAAAKAGKDMEYRDAQTQKLLLDMGITKEKYPYEMQKLAGDAAIALANGQVKEYEATIKKLEAENTPKAIELANQLQQARIAQSKAAATSSYANAENSKANAAKARGETAGTGAKGIGTKAGNITVRSNDINKHWLVNKEAVEWNAGTLTAYAKKKGWLTAEESENVMSSDNKAPKIIDVIKEHYNDPYIQGFFNEFGEYVDSKYNKENDPDYLG